MSQRNSGYERRPNEEYVTPSWPVRALLPFLPPRTQNAAQSYKSVTYVWDPAATCENKSGIVEILRAANYKAVATNDDFLARTRRPRDRINTIVMNPPYGRGGRQAVCFIEHALKIFEEVPLADLRNWHVWALLRIDFDSARTRAHLFAENVRFAGKVILLNRIIWFAREGAPGPSENHAWYHWTYFTLGGLPTIQYIAQEREPRRARGAAASVELAEAPS